MNYIKLVRPINLLIIITTMYLFRCCFVAATPYRAFYIDHVLTNFQFLMLVMATIFIAAGGYVINDIFDVEIDTINKPSKVVITNTVNENNAYNFYKILCALGVVCTIILALTTKNYRLSLLPIIIMIILNFYAHTFKKQLIVGNFMISLCTACTIFIIALYESGTQIQLNANELVVRSGIAIAAIMYGGFAFLTTFLREIIKDIQDKEGDEQYGCRTIPIVFGNKGAKIVSSIIILILLLVLISWMMFFPNLLMKNANFFVGGALVLPLIIIAVLLWLAKSPKQFHLLSNVIKVYMLIGIFSMLFFTRGNGPYVFVQYVNYLKKFF